MMAENALHPDTHPTQSSSSVEKVAEEARGHQLNGMSWIPPTASPLRNDISCRQHRGYKCTPPGLTFRLHLSLTPMPSQEITDAQFDDPNLDKEHALASFEDDSPYPEVRSAVSNTDDPDMPVSTLRAWIIGIAWAVLIPGLNQFFFFRFPSVTVTGIVAQLLSFPVGRAAAAVLPNWTVFGVSLNPGPFTVKEHVLITVGISFC